MLSQIENQLGYPTQFLSTPNSEFPEPDTLYMIQEHIESGFIKSGKQVAPVSLFLEYAKVDSVIQFINTSGLFQVELQPINEGDKQGHIVLHSNY